MNEKKMTAEQAAIEINKHMPDYLEETRGITIRPRRNFICPYHDDHEPSCTWYDDDYRCHCHGCGRTFDLIQLVQDDLHLDKGAAFRWCYKHYGIPLSSIEWRRKETETPLRQDETAAETSTDRTARSSSVPDSTSQGAQKAAPQKRDWTEYYSMLKPVADYPDAVDYLTRRGFNSDDIDDMRKEVLYAPKSRRLVFAISPTFWTARTIDKVDGNTARYLNAPDSAVELYGARYVKKMVEWKEPVFIVEGLLDAFSLEICGGAAVSLQGCNVNLFLDYARQLKQTGLNPVFFPAMDNDGPGMDANAALNAGLARLKLSNADADDDPDTATKILYKGRKDANEVFSLDGRGVLEQRVDFIRSLAISVYDDIEEEEAQRKQRR